MKLILTLTLLLFVIHLAGCSQLDYTKPPDDVKSQVVKLFDMTKFKVELMAKPEPNQYSAVIHIPQDTALSMIVRRTNLTTNEAIVLQIPEAKSFKDENLKIKTQYTYELGCFEDGKFVGVGSQKIEIPEDLVVTKLENLKQLPKSSSNPQQGLVFNYERIFLGPNADIVTEGERVSIYAKELISKNAVIETFQASDQAPENQRGLSGGDLLISAEKLSGPLRIIVRGQTGGSGSFGSPDSYDVLGGTRSGGMAGSQGAPGGNSGVLHLSIKEFKKSDLSILILPGIGGQGGGGNAQGPKGYDGQTDRQDFNIENGN